MSSFTEGFIEAFDYSIYGKCKIQMVHYARFAVFRAKCAPKEENHSLSKIKSCLATIHTSDSSENSVTKFGSIYVEERIVVCAAINYPY